MATKRPPALDAEIDALFRLPLSEFTTARNALAAKLKKEKRAIEAERVKSLAKPPAAAWAVNQLYWEDPRAVEALRDIAARIRQAQAGRLKNADVRQLLSDRKRMTAGLVERAASILQAAGHAASPDAMRRVSASLEALALWGDMKGAPVAGRLTSDLDPPGFDALAAVMAGTPIAAAKVLPFRVSKTAEDPEAARARAREAVQAAEKQLREARRAAERAEAASAKAKERAASIGKQKDEIEARYAEAKEDARRAAAEAEKTARAVTAAERTLAEAKAAKSNPR